MSSTFPASILHLFNRHYQETFARFPALNTPDNVNKKQYLSTLLQKDVLTLPTQGLVQEWMDIDAHDLMRIVLYGQRYKPASVQFSEYPIAQSCHTVAAFTKIIQPELQLVSGFSDGMHFHSWLYDPSNNIIYEPTPIRRGSYYGYMVRDLDHFVGVEHAAILTLFQQDALPTHLHSVYLDRHATLIAA